MNRRLITLKIVGCFLAVALITPGVSQAGEKTIGAGVHYWEALDSLSSLDDITDDGYSLMAAFQIRPEGFFSFEFDLEYFDNGFGGANSSALSPQALVLIGHGLYGGVGIGVTIADDLSDNISDPFYIARGGFEFSVLPHLSVDVHASYRGDSFSELEDFDSDTLTLGVMARFRLGQRK